MNISRSKNKYPLLTTESCLVYSITASISHSPMEATRSQFGLLAHRLLVCLVHYPEDSTR